MLEQINGANKKVMTKLSKEEWLKDVPELIYKLKLKYNFYFSGLYCSISRDILDIVKNPKNRHKIAIYSKDKRFFLVIYKKNSPDIYYCSEYKDSKQSTINYFMRKFRKSYKKAEEDYERKLWDNSITGNI